MDLLISYQHAKTSGNGIQREESLEAKLTLARRTNERVE